MSKSADIAKRLLEPQYVDNDGQANVLNPRITEELMAEAAAEIKRLHDIIHGDGSWDGLDLRPVHLPAGTMLSIDMPDDPKV